MRDRAVTTIMRPAGLLRSQPEPPCLPNIALVGSRRVVDVLIGQDCELSEHTLMSGRMLVSHLRI